MLFWSEERKKIILQSWKTYLVEWKDTNSKKVAYWKAQKRYRFLVKTTNFHWNICNENWIWLRLFLLRTDFSNEDIFPFGEFVVFFRGDFIRFFFLLVNRRFFYPFCALKRHSSRNIFHFKSPVKNVIFQEKAAFQWNSLTDLQKIFFKKDFTSWNMQNSFFHISKQSL